MTLARITLGIFRRWMAKKKIIALAIWSHGEHTETAVLRDDSGSAFQIALHGKGLFYRPSLTVSEYLPESMRVLHQYSFYTTPFALRRDLDRSLEQVFAWMSENKARRLPEDAEMKLVQSMYENGKQPNKSVQTTAMTPPPSTTASAPLSDL